MEFLKMLYKRAQTLISVVRLSDSEDEPVTRGISYKFVVLNSPVKLSPWEKDHKSQMVKPILMKPRVVDQGHANLLQYKFSDTVEQKFWRYHRNSNRHFWRRNWKIRAYCFGSFPPLFSEMEYIGQLHLKRYIFLSNQI